MSAQKINIPMLGVFLGVIASVAAGLLTVVYSATKPQIEANKKAAVGAAMKQVLPAYDNDPSAETNTFLSAQGWKVTFYTARVKGEVVAYAGKVDNPDDGFSGTISMMVGLEPDGTIGSLIAEGVTNSAVIVTGQTETPGLGTAVTDRKVQKTIIDLIKGVKPPAGLAPNRYLDWYAGQKAGTERWPLVKDGPAINCKTGATITSVAIQNGARAVSETLVANLESISKGAE